MNLVRLIPVPARRWGYRLAHYVLRVYWYLARPSVTGVKCVLTNGDRVLLVRHTYGRSEWDLPGGRIKSRETPMCAARREMHEELGIATDDWRALGDITGRADHRHDTLHCFGAELDDRRLALDPGEIADASWFPRGELPESVGHYVARILALSGG